MAFAARPNEDTSVDIESLKRFDIAGPWNRDTFLIDYVHLFSDNTFYYPN